jgi:hypothetical protein
MRSPSDRLSERLFRKVVRTRSEFPSDTYIPCANCDHEAKADRAAIVRRGLANVPITDLKFDAALADRRGFIRDRRSLPKILVFRG